MHRSTSPEMEESQRISIGLMQRFPRRRSVEDRSSSLRRRSIFSGTVHSESVHADDFADVFGGPPRTLLAHKFLRSGTFYEEIFRAPEFTCPASKGGRILPVFRIPARNDGFYSDIFGSDDDRKSRDRSRSLSKETSSSALSSEELSPRRPAIGDDVALSGFASKLSNGILSVPWRWKSSTEAVEHPSKHGVPLFACNGPSFEIQHQDKEYKESFRSSHLGSSRRISSPETTSLKSNSYQSIKVFTDDWELNSQFSAVQSLYEEPEAKYSVHDHVLSEQIIKGDDDEYEDDEDDDEIMSSYVIEPNSYLRREECGESAIDEAIEWAKQKFQSRSSDEESSMRNDGKEQTVGIGSPDTSEYQDDGIRVVHTQVMYWSKQYMHSTPTDMYFLKQLKLLHYLYKKQPTENEKLDRDIQLWSSGNETDIKLLLSTLHHILRPESGWYAIPLMSLLESSQVKKAYQKARLCLHPDKLQQRGATPLQKYAAEKAFSILQDAWAAFISEDVSF